MYELEGVRADIDSGSPGPLLIGRDRDVLVSAYGPRWREMVRRKICYFAANQAGVAAPAGLTTSSTNFTLYNPLGSGKVLWLIDIVGQCTIDPAADAAWWLVGNLSPAQAAPASVTALTVRNCYLGAGAGVGLAYSTATLAATPVVIRPLFSVPWATAAGFGQTYLRDQVDGELGIPPGVYVSVQASAAITGVWSMTWAELDE